MPVKDYWHESPELFFAYKEAYELKAKEQMLRDNDNAWLSGYYNLSALYEVMTLVNADTSKVSPNDLPKYLKQPLDIFNNVSTKQKDENDIIKERTKKVEDDVKVAIANSMIALNKRKIQEKKLRGKKQDGEL
jgi:hypothetical protein